MAELQARVDAELGLRRDAPTSGWLYSVIDAWAAERDEAWRRRSAGLGLAITADPACRVGCVHCCYQHVAVTGIEALVLADHVKARWPAREVEALRSRLARESARFREIGDDRTALAEVRRPCPMLDEQAGLCRAYEARPVNCRRENSVDVEICRRHREDPQATESSLRLVRADIIWGAAQVFLMRWSVDQLDQEDLIPLDLALPEALDRVVPPAPPDVAEEDGAADRATEP